MKQHITAEQAIENDRAFDRLGELYCNENNTCTYIADDIAKWLTIGKMIEILDNHHTKLINNQQISKNDLNEWCFSIVAYGEDVLVSCKDELCDCLWEAVKEIL